MNLLIKTAFILLTFSCQTQISKPVVDNRQADLISHLQKNVLAADLLLHHQVQKKSLIVKQTTLPSTIDSFFSYIGSIQDYDSLCFRAGVFNRHGEIRLFSDSLGGLQTGTLHFVVDGECEGFYVAINKQMAKYSFSENGKKFFKALNNKYAKKLR